MAEMVTNRKVLFLWHVLVEILSEQFQDMYIKETERHAGLKLLWVNN
jgi:hypothetical protein